MLPLVTDTIQVAEAIRNAAMSKFCRWCERDPNRAEEYRRHDSPGRFASPVLSGKDAQGTILREHRHALYLPTSDGIDRRRITQVTIVARDGFGEAEVAALSAIRTLHLSNDNEVSVQLVGLGQHEDFADRLFLASSEWYSMTPYLGPRTLDAEAKNGTCARHFDANGAVCPIRITRLVAASSYRPLTPCRSTIRCGVAAHGRLIFAAQVQTQRGELSPMWDLQTDVFEAHHRSFESRLCEPLRFCLFAGYKLT